MSVIGDLKEIIRNTGKTAEELQPILINVQNAKELLIDTIKEGAKLILSNNSQLQQMMQTQLSVNSSISKSTQQKIKHQRKLITTEITKELKTLQGFDQAMLDGMFQGLLAIEEARTVFTGPIQYHIAIENGVGGMLYTGDFTLEELAEQGLLQTGSVSKTSLTNFIGLQIQVNQSTLMKLQSQTHEDGSLMISNLGETRMSLKTKVETQLNNTKITRDRRWNAGWALQFGREIELNNNFDVEYENRSAVAFPDVTNDIIKEQDKLLVYSEYKQRAAVRLMNLNSILIGLVGYEQILNNYIINQNTQKEDIINSLPTDEQIIDGIINNILTTIT